MVIQRICPRCRTVLHLEDETSLVFCSNCSAPQVRISPELLEQTAAQQDAAHTAAQTAAHGASKTAAPPDGTPASFVPPVLNRWTGAIQCAGLAGAVAAGLTLVSFALPPVVLLTLFWIISAPIVVLGVYAARFRNTRITAAFAARLGILCGLAILICLFSLDTIHLCLSRFVFHSTAELDQWTASIFVQDDVMLRNRFGADAAPALQMLAVPEFRAAVLLMCAAVTAALYLLYSAAAGAFAGLLRSRTPTTS